MLSIGGDVDGCKTNPADEQNKNARPKCSESPWNHSGTNLRAAPTMSDDDKITTDIVINTVDRQCRPAGYAVTLSDLQKI